MNRLKKAFHFRRFPLLSKKAIATIAFAIIVTPVFAAKGNWYRPYYTLKLSDNSGLALNTNNNFRRVYGQPRMSISRYNINDRDQQFQSSPVNSGDYVYYGIKHRSTGKCLNVYNPRFENGAEVNVWPCDPNDEDQMFSRSPFQGDTYQVKVRRPNNAPRNSPAFCLDSPSRNRYGRIHVWECLPEGHPNIGNQLWTSTTVD